MSSFLHLGLGSACLTAASGNAGTAVRTMRAGAAMRPHDQQSSSSDFQADLAWLELEHTPSVYGGLFRVSHVRPSELLQLL